MDDLVVALVNSGGRTSNSDSMLKVLFNLAIYRRIIVVAVRQ